MEVTDDVSVLRNVLNRLFVPHVFLGSILPNAGGGGLQRKNCSLCLDDHVRCNFHDSSGTVCQCTLPRVFINVHDDLCMGPKK